MEIVKRLRRLRKKETLRTMFSETRLHNFDFIMPYFIVEGKNIKQPVNSMPGIYRYSIDNLVKEVKEVYDLGIPAILLFGIPEKQNLKAKILDDGFDTSVYEKTGVVQKAIKEIKAKIPDIVVITDVCLCSYTIYGHCGIISGTAIDNDKTLKVLARIALSHSIAGADMVAPSAMMDGQVRAIREALDKNGFYDISIMSYSAKYASNFYGPFREAANSFPKFGDRKTYQMDYHNVKEALREIEYDINEGADIVMVKPALAYLDVVKTVKENFNIPVAVYNVSGEYSMIKAAAEKGWLDEKQAVFEILTSMKRAGADLIITYWAKEIAKWLKS